MSDKNKHIQDNDLSPTEATKSKREWEDSSYQSVKTGNDGAGTRVDDDHIHHEIRSKDDGRTIIPDSSGKTDIVTKVVWPD
ncbi:hypothetical protein AGMMS50268_41720 [Spirochaetia bacterium]|nr:hypothetical protein AGMMS50268_41720 [Spirochaetia bacterium]